MTTTPPRASAPYWALAPPRITSIDSMSARSRPSLERSHCPVAGVRDPDAVDDDEDLGRGRSPERERSLGARPADRRQIEAGRELERRADRGHAQRLQLLPGIGGARGRGRQRLEGRPILHHLRRQDVGIGGQPGGEAEGPQGPERGQGRGESQTVIAWCSRYGHAEPPDFAEGGGEHSVRVVWSRWRSEKKARPKGGRRKKSGQRCRRRREAMRDPQPSKFRPPNEGSRDCLRAVSWLPDHLPFRRLLAGPN